MSPKHINLKICLAACCLLLALTCRFASAQNKPTDGNALAAFEKSLEQGKINEIERPLLNYAIANPNNTQALELLARVRVRQGRLEEARGLYQRVLTLNPNLPAVKIAAGRLAYALGRKEEARKLLNEIEPTSSLTPLVQLDLAAALFLAGELQKALALTDKLPIRIKNNEALPLVAAIYLETGEAQKLAGLIPLMKKASVTNPVLAVQCAEILQNAGLMKDAADLLSSALGAAPNNAKILISLGRLEVFAREFAEAREHLKRAAVLESRSAEVLAAQALLENATGNTNRALELLSQARQLAPGSAIVLADYVVLAMRAGKTQAAVDAAATLVTMQPENPEFQYLFGAASLQNGNLSAAQESLERFMQKRPNDSRGCLALGLTLAAQRDQIENARKQLNRCLAINPANFEARYQLGLSYKAQGETAKAIEFFEEAVKQAPDYALVLRDLGALYLQTGAEAKARTLLERAVSLNPKDADTHFQLSRLYNRTGESALAKQHLEIFQKLRNQGGNPAQ
ncbi:MAG TPA: tetratricopeptide repeat protein [Pyrinomonadaceae bacterium]|jgi:tetratricopeptide (TPR) repeat protein